MKNLSDRSGKKETVPSNIRDKLHDIIFETHTKAGKLFDVALLFLIMASVFVTILESVPSVRETSSRLLYGLEWLFTVLFAAEYFLRLICARNRRGYALSFLGVIDLIGWLPTVAGLLIPGTHVLSAFRIVRVLRIFRILKMAAYLQEANVLIAALRGSMRKITVFLSAVVILVIILGSLMYLVEGQENGFVSIPVSIYWAVVTLTTVGYGDISPATPLGQMLASIVMIMGYAIIAVPTGIVSAEFIRGREHGTDLVCPSCGITEHAADARFCRRCGAPFQGG